MSRIFDFDTFTNLEEGVNDPAIFKAVFLAGGPGSGKSFIVGKTALTALGFKTVNSDDIYEVQLQKAGLTTDPEDIWSAQGQAIRDKSKTLTGKRLGAYLKGRLGIVIDGTGKDYDKIDKKRKEVENLGYENDMIFVNTDLKTAIARDKLRARTVGEKKVTEMWNEVQQNIGKFQNTFKGNMIIVDNSEGSNWEGATQSAYRKISAWSKKTPKNSLAQKWINAERSK